MPPDARKATGARAPGLVAEPLLREAFNAGRAYESDSRTQTPQGAAPDEDETVRRLASDVDVLPAYAVVMVRGRDGDILRELSSALKHLGRSDVLIVDLGDDDRPWFDIVDEEAMREHGWIRTDQP